MISSMELKLKTLRTLAGVPIEKAAQAAGVSFGTYWNFEHDLTKFDDTKLAALQEFFLAQIHARLHRIESALGGAEK